MFNILSSIKRDNSVQSPKKSPIVDPLKPRVHTKSELNQQNIESLKQREIDLLRDSYERSKGQNKYSDAAIEAKNRVASTKTDEKNVEDKFDDINLSIDEKVTFKDFKIVKLIGKGSFGKVKLKYLKIYFQLDWIYNFFVI